MDFYHLYAVTPIPFFPTANSSDTTRVRSKENHLQYHNFFKLCNDI